MDTFNKGGGGQENLFQSPAVSSVKPAAAANAKFFIPTPISTTMSEQSMEAITENAQEENATNNNPSTPTSASSVNDFCQSPRPLPAMTRPRFPSMDNIPQEVITTNTNAYHSPLPSPHSRRTVSWSGGNFEDPLSPSSKAEIRPSLESPRKPPPMFMPVPANGSFGDEQLHEVEL